MNKLFLVLVGVVFVGAGCFGGGDSDMNLEGHNSITTPGGRVLEVEVARSDKDQNIGLSGREDVGDGMLFCFDEAEEREFWMLGMKTEIDVIWLRDGVVTGVEQRVSLFDDDGELTRMNSFGTTDAVLEVGAGESIGMGVKEGVVMPEVATICQ